MSLSFVLVLGCSLLHLLVALKVPQRQFGLDLLRQRALKVQAQSQSQPDLQQNAAPELQVISPDAPPPWLARLLIGAGTERIRQLPAINVGSLSASSTSTGSSPPPELPPPPPMPTPLDALKAAIAARAAAEGLPPPGKMPSSAPAPSSTLGTGAPGAVPDFLPASVGAVFQPMAVPLAAGHTNMVFGRSPPPPPPCATPTAATAATAPVMAPAPAPSSIAAPLPAPAPAPAPEVPLQVGPPRPPACAAAPAELNNERVLTALAPNKPEGAADGPVHIRDGGLAWPLQDGGWAFQYPKMALRMDKGGQNLRAAWAGDGAAPAYAVEYNENGYHYHVGSTVVSHEANGDLVYHQPTGTVRQEGDLLTYHWCDPNVIVYQTPSGVVYYDDDGITYQGDSGVAHYASNGDVRYQGEGGVTEQNPDGSVTHWTHFGAVFNHVDGTMAYTPTGQSEAHVLSPVELGPDPFPGPPLTMDQAAALADALLDPDGALPIAVPSAAVAPTVMPSHPVPQSATTEAIVPSQMSATAAVPSGLR